jgi:hypothetical protein
LRGGKSGKTKERRPRHALETAVERGVDRGKTAIDLGLRGLERHAAEQRMRKRVVRNGMTLAHTVSKTIAARISFIRLSFSPFSQ